MPRIKDSVEVTTKNIVVTVKYGKSVVTYRMPLNVSGNQIQEIIDRLAKKLIKKHR